MRNRENAKDSTVPRREHINEGSGRSTSIPRCVQNGSQHQYKKHRCNNSFLMVSGLILVLRSTLDPIFRSIFGRLIFAIAELRRRCDACVYGSRAPAGGALISRPGQQDRGLQAHRSIKTIAGMLYKGFDTPWAAGPAHFWSC